MRPFDTRVLTHGRLRILRWSLAALHRQRGTQAGPTEWIDLFNQGLDIFCRLLGVDIAGRRGQAEDIDLGIM